MYCKHCGKETPDDAEYCVECGQRLYTDAVSDNAPDVKPSDTPKPTDRLLVAQIILGAITLALLSLARLFIYVPGEGVLIMSLYAFFVGIAFLVVGIVRFSKRIGWKRHKTAESVLFSLTLIVFIFTTFSLIVVVTTF